MGKNETSGLPTIGQLLETLISSREYTSKSFSAMVHGGRNKTQVRDRYIDLSQTRAARTHGVRDAWQSSRLGSIKNAKALRILTRLDAKPSKKDFERKSASLRKRSEQPVNQYDIILSRGYGEGN